MLDLLVKAVDFVRILYRKSFEDDIFSRAAQVAFYFSFSLFPLLLFLFSLFGLVLDSTSEMKSELFAYIRQIMPGSAVEVVQRTVDEIIADSTGGKLTLGILITVWSASAGMDSLRIALNAVYEVRERRAWWVTKGLSIGMTFALTLLAGFVLGLVFYGWRLVQISLAQLGLSVTSPFVLVAVEWMAMLGLAMLACELIYNLMPSHEKRVWKWITPGSIVAIVLWLVLTNGFRLYLEYFNTYNRTYGSLGAVIILMLWLYLTALVILIGGAINSVIDEVAAKHTAPAEGAG